MKLRLRGNSIRLRLSQTDVDALKSGQNVMDSTSLAPERFIEFGIHPKANASIEIAATPNGFSLQVPQDLLNSWAAGDDEGFEADIRISQSVTTRVTVQKDFACLKPRGEEDLDTFAHPKAGTVKC